MSCIPPVAPSVAVPGIPNNSISPYQTDTVILEDGGNYNVLSFCAYPDPPVDIVAAGNGVVSGEIALKMAVLKDIEGSNTQNVGRIFSNGAIHELRIGATSENFDLSIRQRKGIANPDISSDEIIRITEIEYFLNVTDPFLVRYTNNDQADVAALYLVLTNNDPVNAITSFELELIVSGSPYGRRRGS